MSFCKIIGFTKQIYENKSLSPNHGFTFEISRFTTFIFLLIVLIVKPRFYFSNSKVYDFYILLIILSFLIKIISFLTKIGPLWAHKGPKLCRSFVEVSTKLRQSFDKTSTKFRQSFDKTLSIYCLEMLL